MGKLKLFKILTDSNQQIVGIVKPAKVIHVVFGEGNEDNQ